MNPPVSLTNIYRASGKSRVRSEAYAWRDSESCREYFGGRVAGRLKEGDGSEFLRKYLERMPDTGFSLTYLRVEATQSKPPRDWEVGEAFTEAVLEDYFECSFPWPTSRDQREKEGHPTGPDLPGFHVLATKPARFAFGEVKSSSQTTSSPPLVISGVDGKGGNKTLVGQLRRLLTEALRRQTLISWLGFRATSATGAARFDEALKLYGETGDCLIVGSLVCGNRAESKNDLSEAHEALDSVVAERELWLVAFYIPFEMKDWPVLVAAKGGRP